MSQNVPLTVVASVLPTGLAMVGIGSQTLQQKTQGYWIVVVDLTNLNVVYNQVQTQYDQVPPIQQYNDTNHLLIVATVGTGLNVQPQGAFYQFLDVNGGGAELARISQVATQFNCGYFGYFGYTLVGTMGGNNLPGFERGSFVNAVGGGAVILTLQLMPMQVGGQTVYTPIQLGN